VFLSDLGCFGQLDIFLCFLSSRTNLHYYPTSVELRSNGQSAGRPSLGRDLQEHVLADRLAQLREAAVAPRRRAQRRATRARRRAVVDDTGAVDCRLPGHNRDAVDRSTRGGASEPGCSQGVRAGAALRAAHTSAGASEGGT